MNGHHAVLSRAARQLCAAAMALLVLDPAGAADVNTASQAELEAITGIGPTLSTAILDERTKGEFASWADLTSRVKGIRGRSAARLSAGGLTVRGQALAAPR